MRSISSRHIVVAIVLCCVLVLAGARLAGIGKPGRDHQSLVITDRNGVPLREILSQQETRHQWVGLSEVSPHLIFATIIAEDKRFRRHIGIDAVATMRALFDNLRAGRIVSGGSTITQQLARMLNPRPRTIGAKVLEAAHAVWLEIVLSKDEIIEQYLNRAPYGNQLIGCEAAARMYFGKPAHDLSVAEAAYLTVLPRAPSAFNPYRGKTRIISRQRNLIAKLGDLGFISADEKERALGEPLIILDKRWAFDAPHFIGMLPKGVSGGVLRTTLDSELQKETERLIKAHLTALARHNVTNAAAVIVDNATAEILALVGSGDFFDEETGGQVNGVTARRQPGSTLKPFTYAVALENGYTSASILPDIPLSFPTPEGDYSPQNYDRRFRGPVRMRTALANSLNVPAVHLLSQIGVENLLSALHQLGFESLEKSAEYYGLGLTLGNGEVTLLELAGAYATLARGGVYRPLALVADHDMPKATRVFSPATAYIISDILADDDARRMSFGEDSPLNLGFDVAAKTGTTKNFRDNWTVGYTKNYTVAVWAGNFNAAPMRGVSGVTGAGPLFSDIMTMLAKVKKPEWIKRPQGIVERKICSLSGAKPGENCPTEIEEIFVESRTPHKMCPFHVERIIDTRNDLLATSDCDESWKETRSFVDLPREYHSWAHDHRVDLAPGRYSPHCRPTRTSPEQRNAMARISHPRNKSSYVIDRSIPRRLQTLRLQAESPAPLIWSLNGTELGRTDEPHGLVWKLVPGNHTITIATADGKAKDRIEITVLP